MGSLTSSRHQSSESTADEHPRLVYVPSAAFHTLSTAYSSLYLAGLFHPAATSRFLAPGGSSPDLSGSTSSVARAFAPLAPSPAAGCPTTPESVASTSRPSPRPGSAAASRVLPLDAARVPSCAFAPSGSLRQSGRRDERLLRSWSWLRGAHSAPLSEPSASRSTDDLDALSLDHPPVRASWPALARRVAPSDEREARFHSADRLGRRTKQPMSTRRATLVPRPTPLAALTRRGTTCRPSRHPLWKTCDLLVLPAPPHHGVRRLRHRLSLATSGVPGVYAPARRA